MKSNSGAAIPAAFDGFHHLPFQLDIQASLDSGVDVFVVDVNIAYSPVLEDEHFQELLQMQESG